MSSQPANNEKRPLGFVNRRGHNADVSNKDLNDLSIDEQPAAKDQEDKAPAKDTKKPGKSPKKPRVRRYTKWTRKKIFILIGVILMLVAIPVAVGEVLRIQYLASAQAAEDSLKKIVASDVLPLQKKTDTTAKQVSAVADKLEDVRDSMCPGGLLDNMASLYPRSHAAHEECIDERGKIASLATQLHDMASMLAYIESINAVLAPVSAASTDAFAVIAMQQSSWQQVNEKLQKMNAPIPLKAANEQLVAAVKSITDGWSKLNVANNAQNAADFQAAEKQLNDGYVAVRASKDVFAVAIAAKQSTISQLSQNLY